MRDVLPNLLWIGNAHDARDVQSVLDKGIAAVIDLAMEEPPIQFPRDVIYCRFPLLDGEENSPALLRTAIETVASFVAAKMPTLVAFSNGMSRSPAIVSAALAKVESLDFDTSIERVTSTGPCDLSPTLWAAIKAEAASCRDT